LTSIPPPTPLFPYTTLFRSRHELLQRAGGTARVRARGVPHGNAPRPAPHRRGTLPASAATGTGAVEQRTRRCDPAGTRGDVRARDRKSTRLNSSHVSISYAV